MSNRLVLELPELVLQVPEDERSLGTRVFAAIVNLADHATAKLELRCRSQPTRAPVAAVGRLRGLGRGVSWTKLIEELERQHPLCLAAPFEGSDRVSGAVWVASELLESGATGSIAKLRWQANAIDLPMHVHEHSERFIIVHEGRGFFHVSDESVDEFTGARVRSIPARERDVFLFTRGVVHTFSTDAHSMTLLSCQLPYLPFDDPRQYRLPQVRWIAGDHPEKAPMGVGCDPAWTLLMGGCFPPG
jgi:quercetin dioxygenase-like cupin family protein